MSFESGVKLLLEAIWPEDVVVLLIYDWKDADGWACEGSTDC